ncbi:MAG: glycosyltransferase family 2 protein [Candidatus Coatesbacteria bacterium]|nr:glycosyltransferase family 2 protein [Candidatus Coatesbacteria bacterium]
MVTLETDFDRGDVTCFRGKEALRGDLARFAESSIKVAAIIVSFNSADVIATCLRALSGSKYENIQVIVVDNGSCDSTSSIVRDQFPEVMLVDAGDNLGFAGGCNVGFEATDAEIVILLNDDAVVRPDTISEMVALASSDPDVGIVGCKILYPDGKRLQHAGAVVLPNGLTRHYGYGELDTGQYDRVFDCEYVTGAAMAIKRELLEQLGPFDKGYYPAYFEEAEYCERARRLGYRVVYLPTAVVYHEESRSATKGSSAFYRMYHSGRLRFVLKNFTGRRLLGFFKEECKWLLRYGLRQQGGPLVLAYVKTLVKLPMILWARRRDWVTERVNPSTVKSAIDFSESAFYNRLEGFSPIQNWCGARVRAVPDEARFTLLAKRDSRKLSLAVGAFNGHVTKLKVLVDKFFVGEVDVADYLHTLRFDLPPFERSTEDGNRLIHVVLRPMCLGGEPEGYRLAVKGAWVE